VVSGAAGQGEGGDGVTTDIKVPELTIPGAVFDAEGRTTSEIRGRILEHGRRYAGVPLDILIRQHDARKLRSERANAYYWSTVLPLLAAENEQTPEEVHDAMCALFLPNEAKRVEFFNKLTGESLTVQTDGRRSSKLTGGPFYDFVERVRLWGMEFLGVVTPDPDKDYWRKRP